MLLHVNSQIVCFPIGIYIFKVNNRNTRTRCEICSMLIIKTQERRQWCLYCWLWTYFRPCSSASIVNFEQINADWVSGPAHSSLVAPWCSGYDYCTTSFNKAWTQVLRRLKSCSRRVRDSRWWGSRTMVPAGNQAKRLSSVNKNNSSSSSSSLLINKKCKNISL